jgi:hypothetical protein
MSHIHTLKVTQAEKQIYPQSMGQIAGGKKQVGRNWRGRDIVSLQFRRLAITFEVAAWRAAVGW